MIQRATKFAISEFTGAAKIHTGLGVIISILLAQRYRSAASEIRMGSKVMLDSQPTLVFIQVPFGNGKTKASADIIATLGSTRCKGTVHCFNERGCSQSRREHGADLVQNSLARRNFSTFQEVVSRNMPRTWEESIFDFLNKRRNQQKEKETPKNLIHQT